MSKCLVRGCQDEGKDHRDFPGFCDGHAERLREKQHEVIARPPSPPEPRSGLGKSVSGAAAFIPISPDIFSAKESIPLRQCSVCGAHKTDVRERQPGMTRPDGTFVVFTMSVVAMCANCEVNVWSKCGHCYYCHKPIVPGGTCGDCILSPSLDSPTGFCSRR